MVFDRNGVQARRGDTLTKLASNSPVRIEGRLFMIMS